MKKTVFITGASSGLGRAAAAFFAAKGWNVIATMRSPEKESIFTQMNNVLVTRLDVQEPDSIAQAVAEGIAKFRQIDVLVNNAGYALLGIFEAAGREQIKRQFDVNVFGVMAVTQAVLPHFRQQQSGTIINVSSFGGQVAIPTGSLYNATKFAVEGFSESLAYELSAIGVAVKIVEPGSVNTHFRTSVDLIANPPQEYDALSKRFMERYPKITSHLPRATAEDVAAVIYEAATDGTSRLRYVAGADSQFYIDTKMKNSDTAFTGLMRDYFINE
jgi:NADP-dependent 3-hydroxy acid dehydrogenase YdfG